MWVKKSFNQQEVFPIHVVSILFFLILSSFSLVGQGRVELINAENYRSEEINGEQVGVFSGNVHFRQDTVDIYCNRARLLQNQGKAILTGNVRIHRGNEVLNANRVTYYDRQQLAICEGDVFVKRGWRQMYAQYLKYYYKTDQAFARKDLLVIDDNSGAYVTAEEGEFLPQQNRSVVRKNAHFWQADTAGGDTLHIYAEKMTYLYSPARQAIAEDSVRIFRSDLTATCDSAIYLLDEERVFLEKNPQAQQQVNKMTGQQMQLDFTGQALRKILVRGQAVATSVEDSALNQENRLTGQGIDAFMENRQLSSLIAFDNARSKYYLKDQGRSQGINTASADTIRIFLDAGEVARISVIGGSQGIYYPANYQGTIQSDY